MYRYYYSSESKAKQASKHKRPHESILEKSSCIEEQIHVGDFGINLTIGVSPYETILTLTDRKTNFSIIKPITLGRKASL